LHCTAFKTASLNRCKGGGDTRIGGAPVKSAHDYLYCILTGYDRLAGDPGIQGFAGKISALSSTAASAAAPEKKQQEDERNTPESILAHDNLHCL
jgi:hypothetical protein